MEDAERLILSMISAHRFVLSDHVRSLLGADEAGAAGRLDSLSAAGLVCGERLTPAGERWFRITGSGLAAIDSRLPMPEITLTGLRHQIGVVWLWLAARNGVFGTAERVLSAREMASLDVAARRIPGEGRPAPFACVPVGVDGSRAQGNVYPDLMLVLAQGRVAVHLELRRRAASELESLLRGYAAEPSNRAELFLVEEDAIGDWVAAAARRLGLSDPVMVQRASIGRSGQPSGSK